MHLDAGVEKEACPLNLAPTASTTATLALGDALAVALLDARGFGSEDFARSIRAARSAAGCCVHVADMMRSGDAAAARAPDDARSPEADREMRARAWA